MRDPEASVGTAPLEVPKSCKDISPTSKDEFNDGDGDADGGGLEEGFYLIPHPEDDDFEHAAMASALKTPDELDALDESQYELDIEDIEDWDQGDIAKDIEDVEQYEEDINSILVI